MTKVGYLFSMEELLAAGNLVDSEGVTIAHRIASRGQKFTVDELISLNNPATSADTEQYLRSGDIEIDPDYVRKMLLASEFPPGSTVAHIMAIKGHCFSIREIERLSNP